MTSKEYIAVMIAKATKKAVVEREREEHKSQPSKKRHNVNKKRHAKKLRR